MESAAGHLPPVDASKRHTCQVHVAMNSSLQDRFYEKMSMAGSTNKNELLVTVVLHTTGGASTATFVKLLSDKHRDADTSFAQKAIDTVTNLRKMVIIGSCVLAIFALRLPPYL